MIVTAGAATLVAGLAGCVLVWLLRGRSVVTTLVLTVVSAVLAAVCGVIVAAERMFISGHDESVLVAIVLTAAVIGCGSALAIGLRVTRQIEAHAAAATRGES